MKQRMHVSPKVQLPHFQPQSVQSLQKRESLTRTRSPSKKLYNSYIFQQPQQQQQQQQQTLVEHVRSMSQKQMPDHPAVPFKKPIVQFSPFPGRDPSVFFQYPPICEQHRPLINARPLTEDEEKTYNLQFKILGSNPYRCVLVAFECAGFTRADDEEEMDWNVQWGMGTKTTLKNMNRYQKINHFPGCWSMGRKDLLWKNLSKFKRKFARDYNFIPNTYLLEHDYDRFIMTQESANKDCLWIKKPCSDSRGRGITMISKKTKVKKQKNFLIMDYISNPHLINGFKYDLRVYVLITGFDPLRVYMYKDGLVRFATSKYSLSQKDLSKKYIHLTNFSVNKLSPNFIKNEATAKDDEGSKWSHVALRRKFQEMGINPKFVFAQIKDIVLKTCISCEPNLADSNARQQEHRNGYFELYGFDVIIDERLKPWVLEVNVSPSLNSSSPLDKKIKTSLLSDVLHLVGVPLWNKAEQPSQSPQKYTFQRNLKEICSINALNCQSRLSSQDIHMIVNTLEEKQRCGSNFSCIYPNPKTLALYSNFFEFPRYSNLLIERFHQDKGSWLQKLQL